MHDSEHHYQDFCETMIALANRLTVKGEIYEAAQVMAALSLITQFLKADAKELAGRITCAN